MATPFSESDSALLILIADTLATTLVSQSAEQLVDAMVSTKPSLVDDYAEVALLVLLMDFRRKCRFATAGDDASYAGLPDLLDKIFSFLPDRAFLLLGGMLRKTQLDSTNESHASMKLLRAGFLLSSRIQGEILRSTQSLTRRCEDIAVNVFDLPFLA